jgi:hypothetical protein
MKKNLYPSILATNRQIFREAVKVLYENMHLEIPHSDMKWYLDHPKLLYSPKDGPLPRQFMNGQLARLPSYAHEHIRHITLAMLTDIFEDALEYMALTLAECGEKIALRLPKLQHLRLCVRVTVMLGPAEEWTKMYESIFANPAFTSIHLNFEENRRFSRVNENDVMAFEQRVRQAAAGSGKRFTSKRVGRMTGVDGRRYYRLPLADSELLSIL